jgi:uncharacterized membrane protein YgcG
MIAYNPIWLANLRLQNVVKKELQHGNITGGEYKAIEEKYPVGFYTPNIFVRVGMFILTCIIVLFASGLLSLMAAASNIITTGGWFIFLGLLSYGGLELIISQNHHYRSGVDDALLYTSASLFATGIAIFLYGDGNIMHNRALSVAFFLLTAFLTIRFADMLMAAACCLSFFAMIFFGWIKVPAGLSTAPFIIMLVSGAVYWGVKIYAGKASGINYQNCLAVIQVVSLAVLYAAGNYYVVQTLSAKMMGQTGPVKFGVIFWIWTIGMPFVYILSGIKHKDSILLRVGLLLIAVSVLTFRNYYHILPVDVMLTIGGALVLAIVYAISQYLKTPKHGFTNAEPDEINPMDSLKIESLIVAETFSHTGSAPANDSSKFGGGDFGGGGSSGNF